MQVLGVDLAPVVGLVALSPDNLIGVLGSVQLEGSSLVIHRLCDPELDVSEEVRVLLTNRSTVIGVEEYRLQLLAHHLSHVGAGQQWLILHHDVCGHYAPLSRSCT